ncbi:hypothetical protein [Streptomyces sp. NPDC014894]|uniref:hypothetical protein n=1 Tax=Streptomyces sp. NPDC014894 TaxID=3364931 RepID=UPI0036F88918
MSAGLALPSIESIATQVDFPTGEMADLFAQGGSQAVADALAREGSGTAVADALARAAEQSGAVGSATDAFPATAQNLGVPDLTVPDLTVPDLTASDVLPDFAVPDVAGVGERMADAAADQLQDLLLPALIGLGSLSGALLAGRAAMAGAQALAAAAVRAAESQAALRQARFTAAQSAACWREAAFAAARTNARLEALRARIRRAGAAAGPGPELPPPLSPAGLSLAETWRRLADTEQRLRHAEAACARAAMEAAGGAEFTGGDSGWHTRLRARRREALAEYERTGAGETATAPLPVRPTAAALSEEDALRLGGELLAGLPRELPMADYRLVEEMAASAVTAAGTRPAAARRHLREATRFAERLTRTAERRRADEEWAAQKLAFLRHDPAGGAVPLPDAAAEIADLERVLHRGESLGESEILRISARVGERTEVFQRLYTTEVIRAAVREAGTAGSDDGARSDRGTPGAEPPAVVDWTPPGWGEEHWLRLLVDGGGAARVVTMHRDRPAAEETDADRELDWLRCAEAPEQLRTLERLTERAGLPLRFAFDPLPERPAPRDRAGPADRRAHDRGDGPKARHHDQEPRR